MSNDERKNYKIAKPLIPTTSSFTVDLIIPFREQYALVVKLLEQLMRMITYPVYNIILVDDCSANKNFVNSLTKIKNVKVIQNETPIGFGASVNKAVNQSKTDFICVMHSDTEITQKNFLWILAKTLSEQKSQKVAAVSAVTDNPMSKECSFLQKVEASNEPLQILSENQHLPFFCIMFSKPVFVKLGGLSEFPYCWYEDKIFAKQIHLAGYRMAYDPSCFVKHVGGATVMHLINKDKSILETIKKNKILYQSKLQSMNA
jgi:GT2 family glycosyltransferase